MKLKTADCRLPIALAIVLSTLVSQLSSLSAAEHTYTAITVSNGVTQVLAPLGSPTNRVRATVIVVGTNVVYYARSTNVVLATGIPLRQYDRVVFDKDDPENGAVTFITAAGTSEVRKEEKVVPQ
jgi:hypothetical protein